METSLGVLTVTAATIALVHTVIGPDHYLPFIVISRARRWSLIKTTWITILCGIGHVGSSIVIGSIGIAAGIGVSRLEGVEGVRGDLAAWLFFAFGLGYMVYGLIRAYNRRPHNHIHLHSDGNTHVHEHVHANEHSHFHKPNITPWILFTIFVLGPCEPLIPVLMVPAADSSTWGIVQVSLVFSLITIVTMVIMVFLASYGLMFVKLGKVERFTHAIAGATIALSACAVLFLGL
jgi:nickel/cobalt exporter